MATVIGNFTINVKAVVTQPLSITPSTGALPDETEGVAVTDKVAVVAGGKPPYTYTITGLPSGVTATETDNGDGTVTVALTGAPAAGSAAGSPYSVAVGVADSGV